MIQVAAERHDSRRARIAVLICKEFQIGILPPIACRICSCYIDGSFFDFHGKIQTVVAEERRISRRNTCFNVCRRKGFVFPVGNIAVDRLDAARPDAVLRHDNVRHTGIRFRAVPEVAAAPSEAGFTARLPGKAHKRLKVALI